MEFHDKVRVKRGRTETLPSFEKYEAKPLHQLLLSWSPGPGVHTVLSAICKFQGKARGIGRALVFESLKNRPFSTVGPRTIATGPRSKIQPGSILPMEVLRTPTPRLGVGREYCDRL